MSKKKKQYQDEMELMRNTIEAMWEREQRARKNENAYNSDTDDEAYDTIEDISSGDEYIDESSYEVDMKEISDAFNSNNETDELYEQALNTIEDVFSNDENQKNDNFDEDEIEDISEETTDKTNEKGGDDALQHIVFGLDEKNNLFYFSDMIGNKVSSIDMRNLSITTDKNLIEDFDKMQLYTDIVLNNIIASYRPMAIFSSKEYEDNKMQIDKYLSYNNDIIIYSKNIVSGDTNEKYYLFYLLPSEEREGFNDVIEILIENKFIYSFLLAAYELSNSWYYKFNTSKFSIRDFYNSDDNNTEELFFRFYANSYSKNGIMNDEEYKILNIDSLSSEVMHIDLMKILNKSEEKVNIDSKPSATDINKEIDNYNKTVEVKELTVENINEIYNNLNIKEIDDSDEGDNMIFKPRT